MKKIIAVILFALSCGAHAQCTPFAPFQVLTAQLLNQALGCGAITSGTINGAAIGSTVPATGSFTTLSAVSLGSPVLVGGSSLNATLTLQSTNGSGTSDAIIFKGGVTGILEFGRFTNTAGVSSMALSVPLRVATGAVANQVRTAQTTAPTCSASCGTSPSVTGTDTAMIVTMGSSGVPASPFTITFNGTWAAAPSCIAIASKTGMVAGKAPILAVAGTGTVIVTTNGTAPSTTDTYAIHCLGVQ